jgi:hypothetical protein
LILKLLKMMAGSLVGALQGKDLFFLLDPLFVGNALGIFKVLFP